MVLKISPLILVSSMFFCFFVNPKKFFSPLFFLYSFDFFM